VKAVILAGGYGHESAKKVALNPSLWWRSDILPIV
jgi:hypothetical protein